MQRGAFTALAAVLLLAGCAGGPNAGMPAPTESPTAESTTETAESTTATLTPTTLQSLPSPSRCLTDAAPQPDSVDGVDPATYPEPPENVTDDRVVRWVQSFETAYYRNTMLASQDPDDDMNLTRVSAYAEVRAVNRTAGGYTIRFSNSGATNFESGIHGDYWSDVGYVVTETRLVRVPLENRDDPVRASAGTVVVGC